MSDSLDEMTHACFIIQKHCSSDVMWSKNLEQKSWIAIPFTVTQTSQEHSRRIGNQSEWLAIQYSIQKVVRERYDQKKGVQNEESDRLIMIMTIVTKHKLFKLLYLLICCLATAQIRCTHCCSLRSGALSYQMWDTRRPSSTESVWYDICHRVYKGCMKCTAICLCVCGWVAVCMGTH